MKKLLLSIVSCVFAISTYAADNVTLKITADDIVNCKSGSVELGGSYGSQAIATDSTWYTFSYAKIDFAACKAMKASSDYQGTIQLQGNASNAANMGFIGNTSAINKISQIDIYSRQLKSNTTKVAFRLYVGSEKLPAGNSIDSTVVTTAGDKFNSYHFTYAIEGAPSYFVIRNNLTGALYIDSIKITYESTGEVFVPAPKFSKASGNYIGEQSVEINTESGKAYYTTDGTDPKTSETAKEYTEAIKVTAATTIKAAAKNGETWSEAVSATYTILTPIATMAEVLKAATATETEVAINFDGWVCTGVSGNYTYFTDGKGNGICDYQGTSGFAAGDSLSGSAIVSLLTYNGIAQIKNFKAATAGIKIEGQNITVTPIEISSDDITFAHQGAVVTLKGLSYKSGVLSDGLADIKPYNSFKIADYPTFVQSDKVTYDVTGVIIFFITTDKTTNKTTVTLEIAPRSAEDIVKHTTLLDPESTWSANSEEIAVGQTAKATFTTKSTATVTYKSSADSVATVSADGVITAVGKGKATITATTAENDDYTSSSKYITINVVKDNEVLFSKSEFEGKGKASTGDTITVVKNGVTFETNRGYWKTGNSYLQVYGSKYNEDKTQITDATVIIITAPEGKHLEKVTFTYSSSKYIQTWVADNNKEVKLKDMVATWEGQENSVTFTLNASSQTQLSSIEVTFENGTKEEVSVNGISAEKNADNAMFNLSGQKVNANYKGIVLKGGKKYLVK